MNETITRQARAAVEELLQAARLEEGDILVVGCSTSEVAGGRIGTASNTEIAAAVYEGIAPVLQERGIALAAQCCEHLNRAVVLEKAIAKRCGLPIVNVVPQPKAGGSFATEVWRHLEHPVAVEHISAQAGLDIGLTLIGMHLQPVAVPVRLQTARIGEAVLVAARTRPRFIGGERAHYDPSLL